jgi:hypothetical protein
MAAGIATHLKRARDRSGINFDRQSLSKFIIADSPVRRAAPDAPKFRMENSTITTAILTEKPKLFNIIFAGG